MLRPFIMKKSHQQQSELALETIDHMDDIDIEAQQVVPESTDLSHGDHMDNSTDGESDYHIQELFVEDSMVEEENGDLVDEKENEDSEATFRTRSSSGSGNFWFGPDTREIFNTKLELYKAAIIGDWRKAQDIFKIDRDHISPTTRLNQLGETALHIATAANQTEFVVELVQLMNKDDLAIKTYGPSAQQATEDAFVSGFYEDEGNTALCYASESGNVPTARCLLEKNPDLSSIRGQDDILPIQMAAEHGHQKMVLYLYEQHVKRCNMDESAYIDLLIAFIDCDLLGTAHQMVLEKSWLANEENSKGFTALYAFAQKSGLTSSNFRNSTNFLRYFSKGPEYLQKQGHDLVKLLLEQMTSDFTIKKALFRAAEKGNYEFITIALEFNPDLAFELDDNYGTIFHIAVLHRHMDIFNLVHSVASIKNIIEITKDEEGNNILHLAAKLPLSGLQKIRGEALQLQYEIWCYQKVKALVGKHLTEARNDAGKTPQELFAHEHENLRQKGERWMKETINSCMVVATLVGAVAFAASVTVPGGNVDSTGVPILLNHRWFQVFTIFNALSLISSATSISLFLTILIFDYSLGDFLKSFPIRFTAGLLFLSAAVQAMLVAFVAAFFILFEHQKIGFGSSVAVISSIPVLVFGYILTRHVLQYLHLLFAFYKQWEVLFPWRWRGAINRVCVCR